jgi:acyl-CoA thioester hydrolase
MSAFRYSRMIEFCDTDLAGIMHFSNYFRFMEAAEHAYLRNCGLSVVGTWEGQAIGFPRVSASCDYIRPVRFADTVEVEVTVEKIGTSSVRYAFTFYKGPEVVARGQTTAVLCRVRADGELETMPIPEALREKIQRGPTE